MQRLFVLAVVFFSFNVMGDQPEHPVAMSWNGFRGEVYSSGDLLMGGQPLSAQAMSKLKDEGVLTIVNLRTAKEMADQESTPIDEAHIASQLGIEYVQLPSGGDDGFNQQTVSDFAKVYNNAKGKVLLHCNSGRRATHLWGGISYRSRRRGCEQGNFTGQSGKFWRNTP